MTTLTPHAAHTAGRMNQLMVRLLQSRAHRLASRWFCLVRYTGRRSGRVFCTPTQYVEYGVDILILVGHAESKSWWRNFQTPGGHDLQVLVGGEWRSLRGVAVVGSQDPNEAARLLAIYLEAFPNARRVIAGDDRSDIERATLVHCIPAVVV